MENKKMYQQCFMKVFNLKEGQVLEEMNVMNVEQWDSVAQMQLVAEIEETFDIMFDPEDMIEFTSYKVGLEILNKMGVEI